MSLGSVLSIASGGLADISRQFAVVSQNVANANTPDYAREISEQSSVSAGGIGMGVSVGATTRSIDTALQADLFSQDSQVANLQTSQSALQQIDAVEGTPGQGNDLASLLGQLQDGFSTLAADPSSATQQNAVVAAAGTLTRQLNALGTAVTAGRQTAQDSIASGVTALNASLATIGTLSDQIVSEKAQGQSTADLENQRDSTMHALAQQIDVRFLQQPSGDLLVVTPSGLNLPDPRDHAALRDVGRGARAGRQPSRRRPRHPSAGQRRDDAADRRDAWRQRHAARHNAADAAGQSRRVRADPVDALRPAGPDPVHRPDRRGSVRRRHAGPGQLCRLRVDRAGQSGGDGGARARARRHPGSRRQPDRRQRLHPQSRRRPGWLLRPHHPCPDLCARFAGAGQRGAADAADHGPRRRRHAVRGICRTVRPRRPRRRGGRAAGRAECGGHRLARQRAGGADDLADEAVSGSAVDVDTEMSTMVQLQNAYGANARVLSAVQALYTQLLQMVA